MPNDDPLRAWLDPLRGLLASLHPPDGPFDARSAWQHRYAVVAMQPERRAAGENPRPYGTLTLTRKPAADTHFSLEVDFAIRTRGQSGWHTQASLTCAGDRLATPTEWQLRSAPLQPAADTATTETAKCKAGVITRRSGNVERKLTVPGPFTTSWSLMEAVQRLPFTTSPPITFEMLEDLDQRKPGQSLSLAGELTVDLAGKAVRLHAMRQIGRGILPMHYWLDDQHRLLAVTGGLRGFLWESRKESA
jgi:hypothetical protein